MSKLVATFFYSGYLPKAPGTWGSLASLVLWAPLVLLDISWQWRLVAVAVISLIGIWATAKALPHFATEDPPQIVIDEVAGQGLALAFCGPSFWAIAIGFGLFRFFDVWKPWPIRLIDRQMPGPVGIMIDDLVAGAFALILLYLFSAA